MGPKMNFSENSYLTEELKEEIVEEIIEIDELEGEFEEIIKLDIQELSEKSLTSFNEAR